jgi:putative ABC transport system permease protein
MTQRLWHNLTQAAHGLVRQPLFAAAAILTFGLGIGTTTAVFSVVYAILFKPLPFPNASRLVQIVQLVPSNNKVDRGGLSPEQIAEWQATSRSFSEIGFYRSMAGTLTGGTAPSRLNGAAVSVSLMRALGVVPIRGRMFDANDEQSGAEPVLLLSHRTWTTLFAESEAIVGSQVTFNERQYRVIGVMPEQFGFPSLASPTMATNARGELDEAPEMWTPLAARARPNGPAQGGFSLVPTLALLAPQVSLEQATAEANTLMPARTGQRFRVEIVGAREEQARTSRPTLLLFQAAAGMVLLIACINVVNLLLVRAAGRRRDGAIRVALGASTRQLIGLALCETLLLAAIGGAVGAVLAYQIVALVRALPPYVLPRLQEIRIDAGILAFNWIVCGIAGSLVGLVAVLRALPRDRTEHLSAGHVSLAHLGRTRSLPSRGLVVFEIAAAFALVALACPLLLGFYRLLATDPGYQPERVMTFRVSLPQSRYPLAAAQEAYHARVTTAIQKIPGVETVALSNAPLGRANIGLSLAIDGQTVPAGVSFQEVSAGFFEALGVKLRRGRLLGPSDELPEPASVVVNQAFVDKYFPSGEPLGRHLLFQDWKGLEIVGIVDNARFIRLDEVIRPQIFLPRISGSTDFRTATYVVRVTPTAGDVLGQIRSEVPRQDAQIVPYELRTASAQLKLSSTTARIQGLTSAGFAMIAVVLASIGLYGVLAYSVGRRTREFAIRVAVGASRRHLLTCVLRESVAMSVAGIGLGLVAVWWLGRFLETLLAGASTRDPVVLATIAVLFTTITGIACYLPARRAMQVNPTTVLRAD